MQVGAHEALIYVCTRALEREVPIESQTGDYAKSPMNVYWELTQACALACRHCRAEAISTAHPRELNFEESVAFLRQIPEFGEPLHS